MTITTNDDRLLAALARALTVNPRATLPEIARAAGVSKATLYRFCKTREELIQRLMNHGAALHHRAVEAADLDSGEPRAALRRLVGTFVANREMAAFFNAHWSASVQTDVAKETWERFEALSDAFFLRGQREGVFRIDISAQAMTESLSGIFCMLVDAEARGRIAPASMGQILESMFLEGAVAR